MANLPSGSFNDRPASAGLEQPASLKYLEATGVKFKKPLIFPENMGSPGGYNNHFMVVNILAETESLGDQILNGKAIEKQANGGSGPARPNYTVDQSIVLYMPNTLTYTTQNDYEEVSLTSLGIDILPGAMGTAASFVKRVGEVFGRPLNPRTEILFTNTKLRQFQFDFLFAPSTKKESETLTDIIYQMRLAAAVKRSDFIMKGLLWIPPRKLEIRFYHSINGVAEENQALPKLRPLVIDNLDFDFAPTGVYSAFTNGYPVSTRMMLKLREDEVIDREFIEYNDARKTGLPPATFGGPK